METKINSIGMEMVLIRAGEFVMGSPLSEFDRDNDEGPQHRVILTKDFWIGRYPVTQRQYEQVTGKNPSSYKGPDNPVEMVDCEEATAFAKLLGEKEGQAYDLPTEAQWEYACRAGSTTAYCFGDDTANLGEYAWYEENSGDQTHPVGRKKPNAWGLYDMHGNVWEWCRDRWDPRGFYSVVLIDPVSTGFCKIIRGGCYYSKPQAVRGAKRFGYFDRQRFNSVGFRVIFQNEPIKESDKPFEVNII